MPHEKTPKTQENNNQAYLGSEVESQVTASQSILNEQGDFLRQTERHRRRQICSLAEVDEIFQGEGESDGFGEGNRNVLFGLFDVGVLANVDGAAADIALAGELDAFLGGLNDDCNIFRLVHEQFGTK